MRLTRRRVVAIAAALVAVLGGTLLLRSRRLQPSDVRPTDGERAEVSASEQSQIVPLDQLADDSVAPPAAADRTPQHFSPIQSTKESQRALIGRVVFPPGTPSTEEVRVTIAKSGGEKPELITLGPDGSFTYP